MKRTPIKRRSTKKAAADDVYAVNRQQRIDEARGLCETNTPACPPGPHRCEVVHHVNRRRGPDPHAVGMLRASCDAGHRFIHEHPAWAFERGLLVSQFRNDR